MTKRTACIVILSCVAAIGARAQTFSIVASFDGTDGGQPGFGSLVQGFDGNFYGTTNIGGTGAACTNDQGCGTVFRVTPTGKLRTLYSFCTQAECADGWGPQAQLALATDGNLYGTTSQGGENNLGTAFKITPEGSLTTLHTFCSPSSCIDGAFPLAPLILGTDGNLYGTTYFGAAGNAGTVFKMTPAGTLTTLYTFCTSGNCPDGQGPEAPLVQGTDGNFYGTTSAGGTGTDLCNYDTGCGTVFKMTPAGELTTLDSFNFTDGAFPYAGLVEATDGSFYGTTYAGGGTRKLCPQQGCGTVFRITSNGAMSVLQKFGATDGDNPYAALIQATDGNLYGTSYGNEFASASTLFEIAPIGTLTTLFNFGGSGTGRPEAGLFQATDGNFYGMTTQGGLKGHGQGAVFRLDTGLGPFVETLPTAQTVGEPVVILGTHLRGASGVSFNGTPATFMVVSNTEITATVPAGANRGFVTVNTTSGVLKSNAEFRVIP